MLHQGIKLTMRQVKRKHYWLRYLQKSNTSYFVSKISLNVEHGFSICIPILFTCGQL